MNKDYFNNRSNDASIIDFRIFRNLVEFLALGDSDPIQIPAKIFSLDDGFV